jgi:predicted esterase
VKASLSAIASLILLMLAVGCGEAPETEATSGGPSAVISHESTREISVWVPKGNGPWPVVYALHGLGGRHTDLGELALQLTDRGILVFSAQHSAPDWLSTEQDVECGYRYVRAIADQYSGDLDLPVTFVGFSVGATLVLNHGLAEDAYGPDGLYKVCFDGAPRPDVIVPISGCHYQFSGDQFGFNTAGWTNRDAHLSLIAGGQDSVCEAWQSRDATAILESAGYDVDLVTIDGANHFTVIFHDIVDDQWQTDPTQPAGQKVVEVILEAITQANS